MVRQAIYSFGREGQGRLAAAHLIPLVAVHPISGFRALPSGTYRSPDGCHTHNTRFDADAHMAVSAGSLLSAKGFAAPKPRYRSLERWTVRCPFSGFRMDRYQPYRDREVDSR